MCQSSVIWSPSRISRVDWRECAPGGQSTRCAAATLSGRNNSSPRFQCIQWATRPTFNCYLSPRKSNSSMESVCGDQQGSSQAGSHGQAGLYYSTGSKEGQGVINQN
eukprot:4087176-Pyramimonas_sp.AAC.1